QVGGLGAVPLRPALQLRHPFRVLVAFLLELIGLRDGGAAALIEQPEARQVHLHAALGEHGLHLRQMFPDVAAVEHGGYSVIAASAPDAASDPKEAPQ